MDRNSSPDLSSGDGFACLIRISRRDSSTVSGFQGSAGQTLILSPAFAFRFRGAQGGNLRLLLSEVKNYFQVHVFATLSFSRSRTEVRTACLPQTAQLRYPRVGPCASMNLRVHTVFTGRANSRHLSSALPYWNTRCCVSRSS